MEPYVLKKSGVEWLGDIPTHWKIDRLKDVSRLRDEKTSIKSNTEDYVELEDISQWTGRVLNKRNTLEVASQVYVFCKGDVLFGKLRPYLAKYFYADFDGKCTGEILPIQPLKIDGNFLAYYIGSKHFINHCDNFSYGAKMPRINWSSQMGTFPIPVPSVVAEQKAIVNYLDSACQKIDQTIELKQQQLEKLESYRKSVIHEAVTKGLDKTVAMKDSGVGWLSSIPTHWSVKRIKDIVDLKSGNTITSLQIQTEGHYPVYGGNGLRGYTESYTHKGDKVLIGRQGDLCGNINYVTGTFFATEHAIVCNPYFDLDTFWFGELLGAMDLNQYSNAAAQAGLSVGKIKNLKIPLPPRGERIAIESYLKDTCEQLGSTKLVMENQITKLTQYRKSLIHECVTGKKRIYQGD